MKSKVFSKGQKAFIEIILHIGNMIEAVVLFYKIVSAVAS